MTSSRPPASPSQEPSTVVRLRITRRGQLVLRVAAAVVAVALVALVAGLAGAFGGGGTKSGSAGKPGAGKPGAAQPGSTTTTASHPAATAKAGTSTSVAAPTRPHVPTAVHSVVAASAPWHLATELSREVALPVTGGIELIGGLLNGDHSSSLVRHVALPSGTVTADGTLSPGVHDAAGVSYDGHLYLYAGGATSEVAGIQRVVRGAAAVTVGTLPHPRSDLVAVEVGTRVVLLGGYDGTKALADVLVSSDGIHFTVLTRLPVPVRYPAPVLRGNVIYLYGGDVDRKPTDVIQAVDVAKGTATVVGHLPEPIGHEASLVFGSTVWLAGGVSTGGASDQLWRSDDALRFTRAGSLPAPRSDAGVAMVHGVGYLIGGEGTSARLDTVVTITPGH